MSKWEYLAEQLCSEDELNALGEAGWELICVTEHDTYIFKRPSRQKINTSTTDVLLTEGEERSTH